MAVYRDQGCYWSRNLSWKSEASILALKFLYLVHTHIHIPLGQIALQNVQRFQESRPFSSSCDFAYFASFSFSCLLHLHSHLRYRCHFHPTCHPSSSYSSSFRLSSPLSPLQSRPSPRQRRKSTHPLPPLLGIHLPTYPPCSLYESQYPIPPNEGFELRR